MAIEHFVQFYVVPTALALLAVVVCILLIVGVTALLLDFIDLLLKWRR